MPKTKAKGKSPQIVPPEIQAEKDEASLTEGLMADLEAAEAKIVVLKEQRDNLQSELQSAYAAGGGAFVPTEKDYVVLGGTAQKAGVEACEGLVQLFGIRSAAVIPAHTKDMLRSVVRNGWPVLRRSALRKLYETGKDGRHVLNRILSEHHAQISQALLAADVIETLVAQAEGRVSQVELDMKADLAALKPDPVQVQKADPEPETPIRASIVPDSVPEETDNAESTNAAGSAPSEGEDGTSNHVPVVSIADGDGGADAPRDPDV
jgi:hypothetical protein